MGHAEGLVVLVRVRSAEAPGNDVVRMSCLGLTTFLSAFATVRFVAEKRPANPVVHRPIPARVPGGYRPPAMRTVGISMISHRHLPHRASAGRRAAEALRANRSAVWSKGSDRRQVEIGVASWTAGGGKSW